MVVVDKFTKWVEAEPDSKCDAATTAQFIKQYTVVLLHCFYVGITTWYRFVLDTITDGNFLMRSTLDAFSAMGNLLGSPPLMINGTTLTLKHVMVRLDAIENKILTEVHIENLDKNMHNFAINLGQKREKFLSC